MITTIKYPSRPLIGTTLFSRYHSVFNPIIYEIQRKDFVVASVIQGVGQVGVTSTGGEIITFDIYVNLASPVGGDDNIIVGDNVYLNSGNYNLVGEVVEVVTASRIRLNVAWKGNSAGGFLNLNDSRIGYFIETQVLIEQNGSYVVAGTMRNVPDTKGFATLDPSEYIQAFVNLKNDYDYSASPNKAERTASGIFNLRYVESWQANNQSSKTAPITDTTYQFYLGSVKQVLELYGQNMGEFVAYLSNPPQATLSDASWQSGFEKPTMFPGFPFDVSFIYADTFSSFIAFRRTREFDEAGIAIGGNVDEELLLAGQFYQNRMEVPLVSALAHEIQLEIIVDNLAASVNRAVEPDYVDTDYWEDVSGGVVSIEPPPSIP